MCVQRAVTLHARPRVTVGPRNVVLTAWGEPA